MGIVTKETSQGNQPERHLDGERGCLDAVFEKKIGVPIYREDLSEEEVVAVWEYLSETAVINANRIPRDLYCMLEGVEEFASLTFVKFFERLPSRVLIEEGFSNEESEVKPPFILTGPISHYLDRLVSNTLIDLYRKNGAAKLAKDKQDPEFGSSSASKCPENGIDSLISMLYESNVFAALTEDQRTVMILILMGYSSREVGQLMDKSENAVKAMLWRARANLSHKREAVDAIFFVTHSL